MDTSDPGRRDFSSDERPDAPSEEPTFMSRRSQRPDQQDEVQLSAALGKAIDQIWSELDGLQREREMESRATPARLPAAEPLVIVKSDSKADAKTDRAPTARRERRREPEPAFEPAFRKKSTGRSLTQVEPEEADDGRLRLTWRDEDKKPARSTNQRLPKVEAENASKKSGVGIVATGVLGITGLAGFIMIVAMTVSSIFTPSVEPGSVANPGAPPERVAARSPDDPARRSMQEQASIQNDSSARSIQRNPVSTVPFSPPAPFDKRVDGKAGETVNLALPPIPDAAAAELVVEGLPAKSKLSAGQETAPGKWIAPASDPNSASVQTTLEDFGVSEVKLSVQRADGRSWPLGTVWLALVPPSRSAPAPPPAAAPPPVAAANPPREAAVQPPAIVAPAPAADVEPVVEEPDAVQIPVLPPQPRMSPSEIADLINRGMKFFRDGSMAPARLLFRRAVESGEKRGLLLLGMTYDPIEYERVGVMGLIPDQDVALKFYKEARAAGENEAISRIAALTNWRPR